MRLKRWVALNIMGFHEKECEGTMGYGGSDIESGFWCDWCGEDRNYLDAPLCKQSPLPDFDIIDLMRKLGENNYPIMLRYDNLRESNKFTLVSPEGRICDTDEPFLSLCLHLVNTYKEKES